MRFSRVILLNVDNARRDQGERRMGSEKSGGIGPLYTRVRADAELENVIETKKGNHNENVINVN